MPGPLVLLFLPLHIQSVLDVQALDLLRMSCHNLLHCELVLLSCLVLRLSNSVLQLVQGACPLSSPGLLCPLQLLPGGGMGSLLAAQQRLSGTVS